MAKCSYLESDLIRVVDAFVGDNWRDTRINFVRVASEVVETCLGLGSVYRSDSEFAIFDEELRNRTILARKKIFGGLVRNVDFGELYNAGIIAADLPGQTKLDDYFFGLRERFGDENWISRIACDDALKILLK